MSERIEVSAKDIERFEAKMLLEMLEKRIVLKAIN